VLSAATRLSGQFSDTIPLIDRGSARYKIARLSAALAARTFSHGDSQAVLRVRKCHIEFIAKFLQRLYESPQFGYVDYTNAVTVVQKLHHPEEVKKHIAELPFPKDFIQHMLHTTNVDVQDIQDWCGWDRVEAAQMLSFLVRRYALQREKRSYRKTPAFIVFLRALLTDKELVDRPDFIAEEF
jgi:uncharacterized protein YqgQ